LLVVQHHSDAFLFHAFLNVVNRPFHLWEFVQQAEASGLQYLGDADPSLMGARAVPAPAQAAWSEIAANELEREQYLDFVFETSSRRSLLCRRQLELEPPSPAAALQSLYVAARLRIDRAAGGTPGSVTFHDPSGRSVTVADPRLQTVLSAAADAWPECVAVADLAARVDSPQAPADVSRDVWRRDLLRCFAAGLAELHVQPLRCAKDGADKPCASRLARHQAVTADFVTNLRHESVRLDTWNRGLLAALDGARDAAALAAGLERELAEGRLTAPRDEPSPLELEPAVRRSLRRLAEASLLLRGR
jgi:hypothetical protein